MPDCCTVATEKSQTLYPVGVSTLRLSESASGGTFATRGRLFTFNSIPYTPHWPVENQQAPVLCRFNDWHQFGNTRWFDRFKREIRRIRCTLLIVRKQRLPVISQVRKKGYKKIAAEFFSLPRFIEDKKSYMLCAILSVTGSWLAECWKIQTFIQWY